MKKIPGSQPGWESKKDLNTLAYCTTILITKLNFYDTGPLGHKQAGNETEEAKQLVLKSYKTFLD
jgi:hypothetical protein